MKKSSGKSTNSSLKTSCGTLSKEAEQMAAALKEQYHKGAERDEKQVVELMTESFPDRYNYIVYQLPKVAQLQDLYPILFETKHFLAEFDRIIASRVSEKFYQNLATYCSTIIYCTPGTNPIKELIRDTINRAQQEERRRYLECAGALLALPNIVGENISEIVKFSSTTSKSVFPMIVCTSPIQSVLLEDPTFLVFVEDRKLFETKDFVEAVLLRTAAHYCFDIQYPSFFKNTTTLIEALLLDLQPDNDDFNEFVKDRHMMIVLMQKRLLSKECCETP